MATVAEACGPAVAFTYRSIDRLILNASIPTLQMPGAMVTFLREVCGKPILSPVVFKALTDRFVTAVHAVTAKHRIPMLHATGRTKPGELAQRALRAAARAHRWGVVVVVVHQESARVFASRPAGGRRTNFWVQAERRLVNHYYLRTRPRVRRRLRADQLLRPLSDPDLAQRPRLSGRPAPPPPRALPHPGQLRGDVADPAALSDIAQRFDARLVDQIARRWLA